MTNYRGFKIPETLSELETIHDIFLHYEILEVLHKEGISISLASYLKEVEEDPEAIKKYKEMVDLFLDTVYRKE